MNPIDILQISEKIFTQNIFCRLYFKIINNRKINKLKRFKDCGYMNHHIIPRSFNESDNSKENLVLLTAREHLIVHHLLTKFTNGKYKSKMWCAYWAMCNNPKTGKFITSRQYENLIIEYSKIITGKGNAMFGLFEENHPAFGNKHTEEFKERLSENKKEFWKNNRDLMLNGIYSGTIKRKENYKKENHWTFGKQRPLETRMKISMGNTGKVTSIETKKKLSIALSGEKNPFYGKIHSLETMKIIKEKISGENNWRYIKFSDEEKQFIKVNYFETTVKELCNLFKDKFNKQLTRKLLFRLKNELNIKEKKKSFDGFKILQIHKNFVESIKKQTRKTILKLFNEKFNTNFKSIKIINRILKII